LYIKQFEGEGNVRRWTCLLLCMLSQVVVLRVGCWIMTWICTFVLFYFSSKMLTNTQLRCCWILWKASPFIWYCVCWRHSPSLLNAIFTFFCLVSKVRICSLRSTIYAIGYIYGLGAAVNKELFLVVGMPYSYVKTQLFSFLTCKCMYLYSSPEWKCSIYLYISLLHAQLLLFVLYI